MTDQSITDTDTSQDNGVIDNPWRRLRSYTSARIGLGRSGVSVPTSELLTFQLAHAQARDAVHTPLDFDALLETITSLADSHPSIHHMPLRLHSQASDRYNYLQRPDLGRRLNDRSKTLLTDFEPKTHFNLAIVIADGLSATAIAQNAIPFIEQLVNALSHDSEVWNLAPICLVEQGRVAVGDEVGQLLSADIVLMLIGERPGLSSPDSLGLYLTWGPQVGLTDARRNCISNVRPGGLIYHAAVQKALYLLKESRRLRLSGVNLKDRSTALEQDDSGITLEHESSSSSSNFLIG